MREKETLRSLAPVPEFRRSGSETGVCSCRVGLFRARVPFVIPWVAFDHLGRIVVWGLVVVQTWRTCS